MSIGFSKLMSDALIALGDSDATTWARTTIIWPWCIEAMLEFPILRPQLDDHTNGASVVYSFAMPADFREVISVEYPISQQPPAYLVRKNRLDPEFYDEAGFYDIDRDYAGGVGWFMYVSGGIAALAHIKTQYLANHKTDLIDDDESYITVPDEYEPILVAYVVAKGYRERLGAYMQDPTAHMTIITQMTNMCKEADDHYQELVNNAIAKLTGSRVSPQMHVDKFDRLY